MARTLKYRPGRRIRTWATLMRHLDASGWVYLEIGGSTGRPKHPGFIVNMSVRTMNLLLKRGAVLKAMPNKIEAK